MISLQVGIDFLRIGTISYLYFCIAPEKQALWCSFLADKLISLLFTDFAPCWRACSCAFYPIIILNFLVERSHSVFSVLWQVQLFDFVASLS